MDRQTYSEFRNFVISHDDQTKAEYVTLIGDETCLHSFSRKTLREEDKWDKK
jgi:hypothetical protein